LDSIYSSKVFGNSDFTREIAFEVCEMRKGATNVMETHLNRDFGWN
jgi:hypothetical protein